MPEPLELDGATSAVHLGREQKVIPGVNPPISMSTTYAATEAISYARSDNSTWRAFEEVVGALEGGEAIAFSSGQAATAAVLSLLHSDSHLGLISDCYTGTRLLAESLDSRGAFRLRFVNPEQAIRAESIRDELRSNTPLAQEATEMFWLESPSNPMLRIYPIAEWAAARDQVPGSLLVVDNTIASPVLQRPLDLGADLVVHSASKILSGHSDVIMGVVVARDKGLVDRIRDLRTLSGSIPGQFESYLAVRGIRTLYVRLERSQENAIELAQRLVNRIGREQIYFPGLSDSAEGSHSQMSGPGYMISVDLGSEVDAELFCKSLTLATYATSLGGVETLVERRARHKGERMTPPGLVRMSVGIEQVDDIWFDFDRALVAIGR